jgi:tetratricopeptide (TPR) repeat protein
MAMLLSLGEIGQLTGDFGAAEICLEAGLALARAAADLRSAAATLNQMALAATWQGNYQRTDALLTEALSLARAAGDPSTLAQVLYGLGDLRWRTGRQEAALPALAESLELARACDDSTGVLHILNRLGTVWYAQHQHAAARRWYDEGLELAAQLNNRYWRARILTNLSELERREGDYAAARDIAREALAINRELGQWSATEALSLIDIGWASLQLGEAAEAEQYLRQGLALALALGFIPWVAEAVVAFAHLQARAGDVERALALLGLALTHPAHDFAAGQGAEEVLAELRASRPELGNLTLDDLPRHAQGLVFEKVVQELMQT